MNTPYRDVYTPGDIFYGLAGPRAELAEYLKVPANTLWTVDQFDTYAQSRNGGQAFPGLANNPDFNAAVARATENLSRGVDLNSDAQWGSQPVVTGAVARRKCKTGLDYIAQTHPSTTVHFCLDGIDYDAVADKTYDGQGARDLPQGPSRLDTRCRPKSAWMHKSRSITSAELRWLYRNRDRDDVRHVIQFWVRAPYATPNNQWAPCGAPWEDPSRMPATTAFLRYGLGRLAIGDPRAAGAPDPNAMEIDG